MSGPTLYQTVHGRRAFIGWCRAEFIAAITDGEGMTATERARLSGVLREATPPLSGEFDTLAAVLGLPKVEGLGWPDLYAGEPLGDRSDLWRRVHFRRVVLGRPSVRRLAIDVFHGATAETARANLRRLLAGSRSDRVAYTEPPGARRRLARALDLSVRDLDEGAPWSVLCREDRR